MVGDVLSAVLVAAIFALGYAAGRMRTRRKVRKAEQLGHLKLYRSIDSSWL